jgi:phosphohistidine phosphatase
MQILLVRHGPAATRDPARWPGDEARPLTREGREQTRQVARGLARLGLPQSLLVSSPLTRARSTAEIVRKDVSSILPLQIWEELRPGGSAVDTLKRVGRAKRRTPLVLLVGHEPELSKIIGLALTGESIGLTRLKKAGAALLSFSGGVVPSGGELEWLLTRRQLIALGRAKGKRRV